MNELEHHLDGDDEQTPIWAVFGDLMSGLIGVFVLLLVWVIGYQLEITQTLESEMEKRRQEETRRLALEEALAGPLRAGRVTFQDGRIGISGSVLFALNSAQLQPEGEELLTLLVQPLQHYLGEKDELLMVSGFTDDLPVRADNKTFQDNWELSAQRALTVTRTLIDRGMPPELLFSAAFGAQQPVVPNLDRQSRAKNRRVELAPVPRAKASQLTTGTSQMLIESAQ